VLLGSDYPHQIGDMEKAVKVMSNCRWKRLSGWRFWVATPRGC
jgi:hypothetical protein